MKIDSILINGFKRLVQFSVDPVGRSIEISGRNGQGKSSVIDAIWCALTSKEVPGVPINDKSVSAKIVVGLDDGHTVRMEFKKKGKTLIVEGPNGDPVMKPVAYLENLIGNISFDPFAFVDMQPAKQKSFLHELLKLDLSDLDARKSILLADKLAESNTLKSIEKQVEDLVDARKTERVDVDALLEVQAVRGERAKELAAAERLLVDVANEANRHLDECERLEKERTDLLARLEANQVAATTAEDAYAVAAGRKKKGEAIAAALRAELDDIEDPTEQIRTAGEINRAADAWDRRVALVAEHQEATEAVAKIAEKIAGVEADRAERLYAAKFPVDGLSFSTEGVLFRGLPFDRGNQCVSDILRVGVAIAVAQDPTLRIVRIKDGSLLDKTSKSELLAMLAENGFQAFLETVADCELQALTIEETEASA